MALGEYLGAGSAVTKGLWRLNGNANDASGNANNGTATNVTYVDGKFGQCANFNGSNSRIQGNLSISTNLFTVSFWYNPTATAAVSASQQSVFTGSANNIGGTDGCGFLHNHVSSSFYKSFYIQNTSNTYFPAQLITTPQSGTWYLVTAVLNGTSLSIYLNGILENNVTVSGTIKTVNIYTFGRHQTAADHFNGLLDEVIVEDKARTAEEIQKYYTYAKGRFGIL